MSGFNSILENLKRGGVDLVGSVVSNLRQTFDPGFSKDLGMGPFDKGSSYKLPPTSTPVPTVIPTSSPTPTRVPLPAVTPPVTRFDSLIANAFGSEHPDARTVLKRTLPGGRTVGENTQLLTGPEIDIANTDGSIDRGLFRINSNTFKDFQKRKAPLMARYGIKNYDDMFDPQKNAFMAKIIRDEQGWDAWFAAPKNLLSNKEIARRKNIGVETID